VVVHHNHGTAKNGRFGGRRHSDEEKFRSDLYRPKGWDSTVANALRCPKSYGPWHVYVLALRHLANQRLTAFYAHLERLMKRPTKRPT
jgi:hypothetical protein